MPVPAEYWERIRSHYSRLVHRHGWDQEPMLEFVSWLAASEYGARFYPSNSMHALGLASVATYEECRNRPMVFIVYHAPTRQFEVHYQRVPGERVHQETVPSPREPELLARIAEWIERSTAAEGER